MLIFFNHNFLPERKLQRLNLVIKSLSFIAAQSITFFYTIVFKIKTIKTALDHLISPALLKGAIKSDPNEMQEAEI